MCNGAHHSVPVSLLFPEISDDGIDSGSSYSAPSGGFSETNGKLGLSRDI